MINPKLISMIKRHEGLRLKPYICSAGKLTIGYGRNIEDIGISEEEAKTLLENDIYRTVRDLDKLPWFQHLDDVRQDALIDFCFNVGIGTLKQFKKMIAAIEAGDYEEAAKQLLDSRYARQVGNRAVRVAALLRTGDPELY